MNQAIVIVGATGLIGNLLVDQLIADGLGEDLHLLLRRPADRDYGAARIHVGPPEQWPELIGTIRPKTVISCLGSTMKKAGSKEAFAAIDRDLVGAVVTAAKVAGATHCIAVSSTMADPDASSFYLKVKGQAEQIMRDQGFDRLDLVRPGLLRGNRTNDLRLGESLAIIASPVLDTLLHGRFRRYRSIDAGDVAAAMAGLLTVTAPGETIHENDELWGLAAARQKRS